MKVAIIPARGGSKRIPRKNIKPFAGKPMIAWSIEAARATGLFDRVLVSTDDGEIAEVSVRHGAEVPFMRPARLADDFIGTTAVVAHAVDWLRTHDGAPSAVCCIYPTAPLVQASDIVDAFSVLDGSEWQYVFSITTFAFPVQRALVRTEDGGLEPMFPDSADNRSQDLPEAFHDAGQFYWGRSDAWLAELPIYARHSRGFMLPRWRVQDIDTEEDWARATSLKHMIEEQSSNG